MGFDKLESVVMADDGGLPLALGSVCFAVLFQVFVLSLELLSDHYLLRLFHLFCSVDHLFQAFVGR